jgi:xanthine dehydrogenase/oxidase
LTAVKQDVAVPVGAPGGRAEYRNSLAASFLFKFFVFASLELEKESNTAVNGGGTVNGGAVNTPAFKAPVEERERSAAAPYHRPPVKGVQFFAKADDNQVVGQDYRHMSADYQVSGQALYCDDVPLQRPLHAAFVTSSHPHAKILSVDPSAALAMEGVVGYYSAADVPGDNIIGPVKHDEEVFATEVATCVGAVSGWGVPGLLRRGGQREGVWVGGWVGGRGVSW